MKACRVVWKCIWYLKSVFTAANILENMAIGMSLQRGKNELEGYNYAQGSLGSRVSCTIDQDFIKASRERRKLVLSKPLEMLLVCGRRLFCSVYISVL